MGRLIKEEKETVPELSRKDAGRILENVLKICGMPPPSMTLEELEERVRMKNVGAGGK
ncbi:hypothetical protein AALB47_01960 [Lachnospiraceae bacterium 54-11]